VAINEALVVQGQSNRATSRQYGLSKDAVRRHKQHIPELLLKASQAMEIAEADSLLDQMRDLQQRALSILDKAEEAEDLRTALGAISQARSNLELLAKLQGELAQEGTINLHLNPQYLAVRTAIVRAVEPYPEVRGALSQAMLDVEEANGLS
jgi:hypothetical protein